MNPEVIIIVGVSLAISYLVFRLLLSAHPEKETLGRSSKAKLWLGAWVGVCVPWIGWAALAILFSVYAFRKSAKKHKGFIENQAGSESRSIQRIRSAQSSAELVLAASSLFEAKLVEMGATGKGLHEYISSVGERLPASVVKRLRYIASVRNKVVHEDLDIPNIEDYRRACLTAAHELGIIVASSPGSTHQHDSRPPEHRFGAATDINPASGQPTVVGVDVFGNPY